MMQKRDFEFIARTISLIYDPKSRETIAYHFAAELKSENPKFNASRFLAACMVDSQRIHRSSEAFALEAAKAITRRRTQSRLNRAEINRNRVRIGLKPLGSIEGDE